MTIESKLGKEILTAAQDHAETYSSLDKKLDETLQKLDRQEPTQELATEIKSLALEYQDSKTNVESTLAIKLGEEDYKPTQSPEVLTMSVMDYMSQSMLDKYSYIPTSHPDFFRGINLKRYQMVGLEAYIKTTHDARHYISPKDKLAEKAPKGTETIVDYKVNIAMTSSSTPSLPSEIIIVATGIALIPKK